jgi:hypothetical protein
MTLGSSHRIFFNYVQIIKCSVTMLCVIINYIYYIHLHSWSSLPLPPEILWYSSSAIQLDLSYSLYKIPC